MEGERKRKQIELDWEKLLGHKGKEEEPLELLVVTPVDVDSPENSRSAAMVDEHQLEPRADEFAHMKDDKLEEEIAKHEKNLEKLGPKLPDKGEKIKALIKRCKEEREQRKHMRVQADANGSEKATQTQNSRPGVSDGYRFEGQRATQSLFASSFCRKMEENVDPKTGNAFEKELSFLNPCDHQKIRSIGHISATGKNKGGSSSRQTPFQCPSSLSADKEIFSNGSQNRSLSPACSPRQPNEDLLGSLLKKRNASRVKHSDRMRAKDGQTVVLVDEEEPQHQEIAQADTIYESMKETKIYYPSRDDPESIEICYTDMDCLAPQAYLSSTIMNFYIRYMQQLSYQADRAICAYQFFNTYFYKKLKEAVLDKSNDKETSFIKFRRWWKGVNLFEKSYILIPIHENLHWSLVIICIPDKEAESRPTLLHLDSLGLHCSKSIFNDIKCFLREEWKYLDQGEGPSNLPITERIWKNLPRRIDEKSIVVPQQKNDYDCGLFVLFYMERFIEEAPIRLKKNDSPATFGKKWFKPEEASGLRRKIRNLLLEEFKKAKDNNIDTDTAPS